MGDLSSIRTTGPLPLGHYATFHLTWWQSLGNEELHALLRALIRFIMLYYIFGSTRLFIDEQNTIKVEQSHIELYRNISYNAIAYGYAYELLISRSLGSSSIGFRTTMQGMPALRTTCSHTLDLFDRMLFNVPLTSFPITIKSTFSSNASWQIPSPAFANDSPMSLYLSCTYSCISQTLQNNTAITGSPAGLSRVHGVRPPQ